MSRKEDFSPEEWHILVRTLQRSGLLVIAASPQGPIGLMKETAALLKALDEMLRLGACLELIGALHRDNIARADNNRLSSGEALDEPGLRRDVLSLCRHASRLLAEKSTPAETGYYTRGLLWVCRKVAQASAEAGPPLSSRKIKITEDEREALRQIAFALGLPANLAIVEELPLDLLSTTKGKYEGVFSDTEWELIQMGPIWAGAAVSAASPSGFLGLAREISELIVKLRQVPMLYPGNRLIHAILEHPAGVPENIMESSQLELPGAPDSQNVIKTALEKLARLSGLLVAKADDLEAQEYRRMILEVGWSVANASREGGFLGIGGKRVSQQEETVLKDIAQALNIPLDEGG